MQLPVSLALILFIRWLKSHWVLLSEGESEIKEDTALLFGHSVLPQMSANTLQNFVDVSWCFKTQHD